VLEKEEKRDCGGGKLEEKEASSQLRKCGQTTLLERLYSLRRAKKLGNWHGRETRIHGAY